MTDASCRSPLTLTLAITSKRLRMIQRAIARHVLLLTPCLRIQSSIRSQILLALALFPRLFSCGEQGMGINDELLRGTLIEIDVTFRGVVEPNYSNVDCLGDLNPIMENRLHQLAIVL
jgi:hypothetical protein